MSRRLQIYGIVIIALSLYAAFVLEAPYSWVVGVAGFLFGLFFEIKSLKPDKKTVNY